MAEFIPSLNQQTVNRMTSGEKRLTARLKANLVNNCWVWYDVAVGKKSRYPDFIILLPTHGLLFLEVKDWKLSTIKKVSKTHVTIITPEGITKRVTHPLKQARDCAIAATSELERDPLLRQNFKKHAGKLAVPWGWGIVFPNITEAQAHKAIPPDAREILFPDHLTIYHNEMMPSVDAEAFREQLHAMFPHTFSNRLTMPQLDRIRWHMFPEIRIGDTTESSKPTEDSTTVAARHIKIMDLQQEKIARSLGDGHRVIHGVSGSGKTVILEMYCLQLARKFQDKPILVICFNITLASKLRASLQVKGAGSNVEIQHFHGLVSAQLKAHKVNINRQQNPDKKIWELQEKAIIRAVKSGRIPKAQYAAVLIDEGHDFQPEWLKLATQMIDPDTGSLLLLYDDTQTIYETRSGLGFTLSSVGIKAQGRTKILRRNYRNTPEILNLAYQFVSQYVETRTVDEDHIPLLQPKAAGYSGNVPRVKRCTNFWKEAKFAVNCLQEWQQQGVAWKDMAVLTATTQSSHGGKITHQLQQAGIPFMRLTERKDKLAYDPNQDQVNVLTVYSSKGLEFSRVIIVGIGQMKEAEKDLSQGARLLYVGMTRAQEQLILTSSADNAYTEQLLRITAAKHQLDQT